MTIYTVEKCSVYTGGRLVFEAPGVIEYHRQIDNSLLILYEIPFKERASAADEVVQRNVLSINKNGGIEWRIEKPLPGDLAQLNFYIAIIEDEKGELWAHSGNYSSKFDPKTGRIQYRKQSS